jgi:TRAP transporter TAXI family solute receptor
VTSRREFLSRVTAVVGGGALSQVIACDPREYARKHGATLRLSIAAGNTGGVFYPYGGAIAAVITRHVPRVAATAEVTGGTVDNLQFIRQGTADLGFCTADMLDEAYRGTGVFEKVGKVPVRALANLYYSYLHVATLEETGIRSLSELRGKVASVGSPGSSTEVIAIRVMRAAGLDIDRDVRRQNLGISGAADALRDRKVDVLFWIGGLPTAAILELASTGGRRLVLLSTASVADAMGSTYTGGNGGPLYVPRTIPAGAYRGIDTAVETVGLSNILVADAAMSDDLAYEITRSLFDNHAELLAVHAEARQLTVESAVEGTPIDYHDGAIRYYRERGVWKI